MTATVSPQTETLHSDAVGLELRDDVEILSQLLSSQQKALECVTSALPEIAAASELLVKSTRNGGCIHYAAAGSSALMGLADGAEIPGTSASSAGLALRTARSEPSCLSNARCLPGPIPGSS